MSQDVSIDGVLGAAEPEAAQEAGVAKKTLGLGFWLAVGWIVLIVLLAIFAPWLPLKDPNENFIDIQGKGSPAVWAVGRPLAWQRPGRTRHAQPNHLWRSCVIGRGVLGGCFWFPRRWHGWPGQRLRARHLRQDHFVHHAGAAVVSRSDLGHL